MTLLSDALFTVFPSFTLNDIIPYISFLVTVKFQKMREIDASEVNGWWEHLDNKSLTQDKDKKIHLSWNNFGCSLKKWLKMEAVAKYREGSQNQL